MRSGKDLQEAASHLKDQGDVELWNFVGDNMKTFKDIKAAVAQVWRLRGDLAAHPMFHLQAPYPLSAFKHKELEEVCEWLGGKWRTHALVLSGDGGLGKSNLGEALLMEVCHGGYWFIDDPDGLRELEG